MYDVIVLGSGPAGEKGAATAALLGKKVAIVERETVVGGASTNTGTIPSKTLRETALALSGLQARDLYGVDLSLRREATVRDFLYHEEHVKANERQRVAKTIRHGNIDLYRGTASFLDPHAIKVHAEGVDTTLETEKVLIATGSAPCHPPGFAFEDDRIHDSDEILSIQRLPHSLAVVGAGVIGSEYACTFAALGCEVHMLDGRDCLLPFLDPELSQALETAIARIGVRFHKAEKVVRCTPAPNAGPVELVCQSGLTLSVDQVLVAAGRTSNTQELNLTAAGITPGERGLITVDKYFQTTVPGIYAAGDVIGFPALAATSAAQGRIAMHHAFEVGFSMDLDPLLPSGIYTIPEVSMVGETEESLRKKGIPYIVGRARYADNARGEIIGDESGFLKLLYSQDGLKLLGVHVIGEHATEVVHIGLMVMLAGGGAELLSRACFNYPTLGDLYKHANYNALLAKANLPQAD